MLFCLRAEVHGNLRLSSDLTIQDGDIITHFATDSEGRLNHVSACISVSAAEFKTTVQPGTGDAKLSIVASGDREVSERLRNHLQALESHLAFSTGALRSIVWQTVTQERIPETAEEEPSIPLRSIGLDYRDPRPVVVLQQAPLAEIVAASNSPANDDRELVILKAFWREAMNDYTDQRYIQAFYNFYFVIEGLFAHGKSDKKQVLKEFAKSAELTAITHDAMRICFADPHHRPHLKHLFREQGCAMNVEDALLFLFKMRGLLHHYSIRSTQRRAEPFSQNEFHSPAWFLMYFATQAIANRDAALPHAMPEQPE